MKLKRQLGRRLFNFLPAYSRDLFEFCVRYVDRFNGDNNSDPTTNGEYLFLRNVLRKLETDVVFDVGANVGDWALYALSINPNINIHCFEPSKATYVKLLEKGWPPNVRANNFGFGEVEGDLELNVVGEGSGLNSIYPRRGMAGAEAVKTEKIKIATIDSYCVKNRISQIDLVKVDVEGHELSVFKGRNLMLEGGHVRVIQFEYGGCNLDARIHLVDIWDFLAPYGFKFYKLFPEGPRYIEKYQQSLETFKYSNWVAILEGPA